MSPQAVVHVRLSEVAMPFVTAALDLLQAVTAADDVLITDEVRAAADALLKVVEEGRGEL